MTLNIGNPDENTVKALEIVGWTRCPIKTNASMERWQKHHGFVEVDHDGYAQVLLGSDNDMLTVNDIIGFALLRGIATIGTCPNCDEPAIQPQTDVSPCMSCGFWNVKNTD